MKVLVVGAAGKPGRPVAGRAVKEGHEVTAFVHSAGATSPAPGCGPVTPLTWRQWRPRSWVRMP